MSLYGPHQHSVCATGQETLLTLSLGSILIIKLNFPVNEIPLDWVLALIPVFPVSSIRRGSEQTRYISKMVRFGDGEGLWWSYTPAENLVQ